MKIYLRKGKRNYKEQKMIKELNDAISKKIAADPDFESRIIPARNENELQSMYNKYIVEDVEFEETKTTEEPKSEEKPKSRSICKIVTRIFPKTIKKASSEPN